MHKFKVGDTVRKVRGTYAPYIMVVTKVVDGEHEGGSLFGTIIEGGDTAQRGYGSPFESDCELVTPKSTESTDAELAATYRAGRAAGVELNKRGFNIRNKSGSPIPSGGTVTITRPEVYEIGVKSPKVEL